jgi:hypothetical protein
MATLVVPEPDQKPWPTLGPQLAHFLEQRAIFGPGDLAGQPAVLSDEKYGLLEALYEVYPKGARYPGRRRFKRAGWSVRKGLAKTEFGAWVTLLELHPEAPVRFDRWAKGGEVSSSGYVYQPGEPIGRPVMSPYIPMLAYNKDQVEELAFGALAYIIGEGPDADLFDVSLERIIRLSARGKDDGKALPLAQSPNALDGGRTTFQLFDEPHRMYLPRLLEAHNTMANNLTKRPAADAWSFYVGTAGQLGQGSIAEQLYSEATDMTKGRKDRDPRFFFLHRDSGPTHTGDDKNNTGHDISTKRGRIAAIKEATGLDGEYGPGQFEDIAEVYARPKTDKAYWERVQLNRWIQSDRQAFDIGQIKVVDKTIPLGSIVTVGFDGARFRDATGMVLTDVRTGLQQVHALWERPPEVDGVELEWEVDPDEVSATVHKVMKSYRVFRFNGDPPHYVEQMATWAGMYPGVVDEWWTQRKTAMAYAIRSWQQGIRSGDVKLALDKRPATGSPVENETLGEAFIRHIGNAGRRTINLWDDDDGVQLFILDKLHPERKFDLTMAAILSWEARLAALQSKNLAKFTRRSTKFQRLR